MKIIDLLVKIANGEEAPEKIKKNDDIFIYDKKSKFYKLEDGPNVFNFHIGNLNDEIEIIEEPKRLEKITVKNWNLIATNNERLLKNKINEIIDKVNKIGE